MSAERAKAVVTEAVAVFDGVRALDAAVEALRRAGFRKSDISLLATEDAVEKKLGHRYERVEELEDPTLYLIAVVNLVFVYYLFRVHRREWLGGPGPLEVRPTPGGGVTTKKPGPGNDEGRPPSQ